MFLNTQNRQFTNCSFSNTKLYDYNSFLNPCSFYELNHCKMFFKGKMLANHTGLFFIFTELFCALNRFDLTLNPDPRCDPKHESES